MATIDAERVREIFMDCLFRGDEPTEWYVPAEGVTTTVGFHPERLKSHRGEVAGMLANLPEEFQVTGGGGHSFLNACNDIDGGQWTGLHQRMEQLFQLGIGLGMAKPCLPRELWSALPGGMPYFSVNPEAGA